MIQKKLEVLELQATRLKVSEYPTITILMNRDTLKLSPGFLFDPI